MLRQKTVVKEICLWISQKEKYLSFGRKEGYSKENFSTSEEMWVTVHNLIMLGTRYSREEKECFESHW